MHQPLRRSTSSSSSSSSTASRGRGVAAHQQHPYLLLQSSPSNKKLICICVAIAILVLVTLVILPFTLNSKRRRKYSFLMAKSGAGANNAGDGGDDDDGATGNDDENVDLVDSFHLLHKHKNSNNARRQQHDHDGRQYHEQQQMMMAGGGGGGGGRRFYQLSPQRRREMAFEAAMRSARENHLDSARDDVAVMNNNNNELGHQDGKKQSGHSKQKMMTPFERLEHSLEEQHREYLHASSNIANKHCKETTQQQKQDNKPVMACSSDTCKDDTRIALVATDLYRAVDAYFECAFGFDELRPFRCTGYNWANLISIGVEDGADLVEHLPREELERQQQQQQQQQHEQDVKKGGATKASSSSSSSFGKQKGGTGIMMSLVDALSTLILTDSAVTRFVKAGRGVTGDDDVSCQLLYNLVAPRFAADGDQQTRQQSMALMGDHERALRNIGLSNTTALAIAAVLEQLEPRIFLYNHRYLSVFELNIRIVGGLLSAHDLLMRLVEADLHHHQQQPGGEMHNGEKDNYKKSTTTTTTTARLVKEVAASLLKLSVKVANALLPAFEVPPHFNGSTRFGFPNPFLRTTDSANTNNRQGRNLYLSEVGTFDLEFIALSQRTGCDIFEAVAKASVDALLSAKVSARYTDRWEQKQRRVVKRRLKALEKKQQQHQRAKQEDDGENKDEKRNNKHREENEQEDIALYEERVLSLLLASGGDDVGLKFTQLFAAPVGTNGRGMPVGSESAAGLGNDGVQAAFTQSECVGVVWRSDEVSMGALADSYFEYRVKALLLPTASSSSFQNRNRKIKNSNTMMLTRRSSPNHLLHPLGDVQSLCRYPTEATRLMEMQQQHQKKLSSADESSNRVGGAAGDSTTPHLQVHRMLASLDDLMVECFDPSTSYQKDLRLNDGQDDGVTDDVLLLLLDPALARKMQKLERCFVSKLKGAHPVKFMTHLGCFTGGMFALASTILPALPPPAAPATSPKNQKDERNINDDDKKKSEETSALRQQKRRMMQVARGLALTCSDMSRVTDEGIAGEEYAATNLENRNVYENYHSMPSRGLSGMKLHQDFSGDPNQHVNQQHVLRPEALETMYYTAVISDGGGGGGDDDGKAEETTTDTSFSDIMRQEAWRIFVGMRRRCRSPKTGGFSGLKEAHVLSNRRTTGDDAAAAGQREEGAADQQNSGDNNRNSVHRHFRDVYDDVMPSFAFAEMFKYSLLIHASSTCEQFNRQQQRRAPNARMPLESLYFEVACGAPFGRDWVFNTEAHPFRI